jgi:hypothetical protein
MTETPKSALMRLANENPAEHIAIAQVNGQLKMTFAYLSPASALVMIHQLKRYLYENINKKFDAEVVPKETDCEGENSE